MKMMVGKMAMSNSGFFKWHPHNFSAKILLLRGKPMVEMGTPITSHQIFLSLCVCPAPKKSCGQDNHPNHPNHEKWQLGMLWIPAKWWKWGMVGLWHWLKHHPPGDWLFQGLFYRWNHDETSWNQVTGGWCRWHLVGGWFTPLKNMSSSIGMMKFPIFLGK